MTASGIEKFRALVQAAQPGPWTNSGWHVHAGARFSISHHPIASVTDDSEATAAFIAACDPSFAEKVLELHAAGTRFRTLWIERRSLTPSMEDLHRMDEVWEQLRAALDAFESMIEERVKGAC